MQQDDRVFALVGACVAMAVAAVAALMWLGSGITVDAPQRATVHASVAPTPPVLTSEAPAAATIEAATVADEDNTLVREAVARLSKHPGLAAYLVNDRLLTRFVAAVDAIAGGYSPREQVDFLRPQRPFLVREDDGGLVAAFGSFSRYDAAIDAFDSISVDGAVELYRSFGPRLEEIYAEIGWAGEDFDTRLREAIDHLLEVEGLTGPFELEQRSVVYAYADDNMEQLSDAQKQLIRTGPANTRRVLAKLAELRGAFGWPEAAAVEEDFPAMIAEIFEADGPDAADVSGAQAAAPVAVDSLAEEIPIH